MTIHEGGVVLGPARGILTTKRLFLTWKMKLSPEPSPRFDPTPSTYLPVRFTTSCALVKESPHITLSRPKPTAVSSSLLKKQ